MNVVIEIILLITSILSTIIICIANTNKQIIWSYIVFDYDIDEYYE